MASNKTSKNPSPGLISVPVTQHSSLSTGKLHGNPKSSSTSPKPLRPETGCKAKQ